MTQKKKICCLIAAAGSVVLHSTVALSQAQLEEVIVTAQKREQNLQDVPLAVSAVSRDLIEKAEINNIADLTKLVPSMRFTQDAYINSSVNIRGVGTNVYSIAVEPNVSIMLDGVVLSRTSMASFDFADIERVEVLRGPQGTLFGKNASAGLVHVITRDPADEFEARVRASYEKAQNTPGDYAKLQATASGPLANGLGLRVTAYANSKSGHLENLYTGNDEPDIEQQGIRGKLRWDASDTLTAKLILEYQHKDGKSGLITYRDGNPTLRARSAPIQFSEHNRQARSFDNNQADGEGKAATFSVDWDIGRFVISLVTGYREADNQDNITVYGLDGQRGHLKNNLSDISVETFTQELRITSGNSERFEYTAGVLWFDNEVIEDYDRDIEDLSVAVVGNTVVPGVIGPLSSLEGVFLGSGIDSVNQYYTRDAQVDTTNLGVFAEATWHIASRWHLTAGARYIDETVDATLTTYSALADGATDTRLQEETFPLTDATVSDQTATGKLALMYDLTDDLNLYASASTGYRGSAFDVAGEDPAFSLQHPVKPEKATSYELGMKSRLWDNRLELNITGFLTTFKNFQAQIRDLENTGSIVSHRLANAGELETKGVEVELHAKPFASLSVVGSFLYNKAVYNDFITQCFAGQRADEGGAIDEDGNGTCDAQDVSGGVLANAPEYSASLTTRYDHEFESGHNAYAQLSGRWQDEVQFTNEQTPTTIQDAYSIWDLRLGLEGPAARYEVAGYVKNLFAENYVTNITPLTVYADRRDVVHFLPMDADRMFGVSMTYRW